MALTAHEIFHLNAILSGQIKDKKDPAMIAELEAVGVKGISKTPVEYQTYLDGVKTKVNDILASEVFPKLEHPSEIHNYLEDK